MSDYSHLLNSFSGVGSSARQLDPSHLNFQSHSARDDDGGYIERSPTDLRGAAIPGLPPFGRDGPRRDAPRRVEPRLWTPDEVMTIPIAFLVQHHPEIRKMNEERATLLTTSNNLSAVLARTETSNSSLARPDVAAPRPNTASQAEEIIPREAAFINRPRKPLPKFANTEDMLLTKADAQRFHPRYGRLAVTRDVNGEIISKERELEIREGIRRLLKLFDTFNIDKNKFGEDVVKNFMFWYKNYYEHLVHVAQLAADEFEELEWCENYYKPFRWIEIGLKNHNATLAAHKEGQEAEGDSDDDEREEVEKLLAAKKRRAEQTERQRGQKKDQPAKRKADTQKDERSKNTKRRNTNQQSQIRQPEAGPSRARPAVRHRGDDDLPDDADADVQRILDDEMNGRNDFSEDSGDDLDLPLPKLKSHPKNTSKAKEVSRKPLVERRAPPQATTSASANARHSPTPSRSLAATLAARAQEAATNDLLRMRNSRTNPVDEDPHALVVPPTTQSIRQAMKSRYAELDDDLKEPLMQALETLDDAEAEGHDRTAEGDADFLRWLKQLELIERDPTDEDGDRSFSVFGHDAIGTYRYREHLGSITSWGGAENACRLLSALLRIWRMSKDQLNERPNDRNRPCVRTHLESVCAKVSTVFDPLNSQAKGSHQGDDEEDAIRDDDGLENIHNNSLKMPPKIHIGASQAKGTMQPETQAEASQAQSTRRRTLKDGYITDGMLKKLPKPGALRLLEALKVDVADLKKMKKDDIVGRLVDGRNKKEFDISTQEYTAAMIGNEAQPKIQINLFSHPHRGPHFSSPFYFSFPLDLKHLLPALLSQWSAIPHLVRYSVLFYRSLLSRLATFVNAQVHIAILSIHCSLPIHAFTRLSRLLQDFSKHPQSIRSFSTAPQFPHQSPTTFSSTDYRHRPQSPFPFQINPRSNPHHLYSSLSQSSACATTSGTSSMLSISSRFLPSSSNFLTKGDGEIQGGG
ncbi:hypothetical protein A4X13_0g8171 [Tilletia indica]|uniref:Uncharacterized protein n=1 Tax=Tilletia indica TaxID=43049 RepID=A0A8T8SGE4_9BASI|nr:hypothetical protein A4X13_0g8171 [Tilletia indica]